MTQFLLEIRSGTVPTPLVVGLGAACAVAKQEMEYDHKRISYLSKRLIDSIKTRVSDVIVNGDRKNSYPGCVNLSFAFVEGEYQPKNVLKLKFQINFNEMDPFI